MTISRVHRSKNEARSNYDRLSRWYDLLSLNSEQQLTNLALQHLDLAPGETVLEIGCGTGNSLIQISQEVYPTGRVIGMDLSFGMLSIAESKINRILTSKVIHLLQGDGEMLPIISGKIDALLLSFTLELFDTPEIASVIAECKRVLCPSGKICVVGLSRKPGDTLPVQIYEWFHHRMPSLVDCRPILIEQALTSGGFKIDYSISKKLFGLPIEIVIAKN